MANLKAIFRKRLLPNSKTSLCPVAYYYAISYSQFFFCLFSFSFLGFSFVLEVVISPFFLINFFHSSIRSDARLSDDDISKSHAKKVSLRNSKKVFGTTDTRIFCLVCMCIRYHSRLFVQVGHEIINTASGKIGHIKVF